MFSPVEQSNIFREYLSFLQQCPVSSVNVIGVNVLTLSPGSNVSPALRLLVIVRVSPAPSEARVTPRHQSGLFWTSLVVAEHMWSI